MYLINRMLSRVRSTQLNVMWRLFLVTQMLSRVLCLKDLKITVPEAVAIGDTVTLTCHFDLEKAALYSVKWYFELDEFYRYVPKESPPERVFTVHGVSVDLSKSDEHTVTLRSVSKLQSGMYQCEVSADAPLFHTDTRDATMIVAELPKTEPVLTLSGVQLGVDKRILMSGDNITAICISGPSEPLVNFTWTINGHHMQARHSGLNEDNNINPPRITETWSKLVTRIDEHMLRLPSRKLIIRCETNIYSLYRGADEAEIFVLEREKYSVHGAKVSPTTDQRSGANRGDPDNSALTGSAKLYYGNLRCFNCFNFIYLISIIYTIFLS